jgi:hypothetical protein
VTLTLFECTITESSAQLVETAARERFNDSAALVMRAVLKSTESKQRDVSDVRSGLSPLCPFVRF